MIDMSTPPSAIKSDKSERPAIVAIDHQVTYLATPQLQQMVRKGVRRRLSIQRTLESTYFDAKGLPLYRSGAMLRERGRAGRDKRRTEAKLPSGHGLLRLKDDAALTAAWARADHRQLLPVATQTKARHLVLVPGTRTILAPDFVIALDHATVTGHARDEQHERYEIELQLFTALPWTAKVDDERVERFHEFCRSCEADFGLVPANHSGYQAIPEEMLA